MTVSAVVASIPEPTETSDALLCLAVFLTLVIISLAGLAWSVARKSRQVPLASMSRIDYDRYIGDEGR